MTRGITIANARPTCSMTARWRAPEGRSAANCRVLATGVSGATRNEGDTSLAAIGGGPPTEHEAPFLLRLTHGEAAEVPPDEGSYRKKQDLVHAGFRKIAGREAIVPLCSLFPSHPFFVAGRTGQREPSRMAAGTSLVSQRASAGSRSDSSAGTSDVPRPRAR